MLRWRTRTPRAFAASARGMSLRMGEAGIDRPRSLRVGRIASSYCQLRRAVQVSSRSELRTASRLQLAAVRGPGGARLGHQRPDLGAARRARGEFREGSVRPPSTIVLRATVRTRTAFLPSFTRKIRTDTGVAAHRGRGLHLELQAADEVGDLLGLHVGGVEAGEAPSGTSARHQGLSGHEAGGTARRPR